MDALLRLCLCLGRAHPGDWVDWLGHCQQRRAVLVHGFACTQPKLEMLLLSVTYSILVDIPSNEISDYTSLLISNRPPTSDFACKYTLHQDEVLPPSGAEGASDRYDVVLVPKLHTISSCLSVGGYFPLFDSHTHHVVRLRGAPRSAQAQPLSHVGSTSLEVGRRGRLATGHPFLRYLKHSHCPVSRSLNLKPDCDHSR